VKKNPNFHRHKTGKSSIYMVCPSTAPLTNSPRHPRKRIAHGTVGLVRVFSVSGLMSRASSILNSSTADKQDQQAAQTVLPGMPSDTPYLVRLVRLVRTFLQGRDEHQGGKAACKGQGAQIN
jgi:hypothetical protein